MPIIEEFQCIMPIINIPSVVKHGIVSHDLAERLGHSSVALESVQNKRVGKQITGGGRLHSELKNASCLASFKSQVRM